MIRVLLTLVMVGCATLASGCAATRPATTHVVLKDCAKGERCVDFHASPIQGRGGGIHKVTFLTQTNAQGQQVTAPVVTSNGPDRIDTLVPPLLMGGAHVWAADIQASAIKFAGKNSGPGLVIVNEGGNAQLLNENTIGVEQRLGPGLAPVDACNTCGD